MIAKLIAGPLGPFLLPLFMVFMAGIAAASFYAAWSWQDSRKEHAINAAVATQVALDQKEIDRERGIAAIYRSMAEGGIVDLGRKIDTLRKSKIQIVTGTNQAIAANPKLYEQPLDEKGYAQWQAAKDLIRMQPKTATPPKPPASADNTPPAVY